MFSKREDLLPMSVLSAELSLEDFFNGDTATTTKAPPKVVPKVPKPTKAPAKPKPKPGETILPFWVPGLYQSTCWQHKWFNMNPAEKDWHEVLFKTSDKM